MGSHRVEELKVAGYRPSRVIPRHVKPATVERLLLDAGWPNAAINALLVSVQPDDLLWEVESWVFIPPWIDAILSPCRRPHTWAIAAHGEEQTRLEQRVRSYFQLLHDKPELQSVVCTIYDIAGVLAVNALLDTLVKRS